MSQITNTPFGFFMTLGDDMCTVEWARWAAVQRNDNMEWFKEYPGPEHIDFVHYNDPKFI